MLPFGYDPANYGGRIWWNEDSEMREIWGTQEDYDKHIQAGGTWAEYIAIVEKRRMQYNAKKRVEYEEFQIEKNEYLNMLNNNNAVFDFFIKEVKNVELIKIIENPLDKKELSYAVNWYHFVDSLTKFTTFSEENDLELDIENSYITQYIINYINVAKTKNKENVENYNDCETISKMLLESIILSSSLSLEKPETLEYICKNTGYNSKSKLDIIKVLRLLKKASKNIPSITKYIEEYPKSIKDIENFENISICFENLVREKMLSSNARCR